MSAHYKPVGWTRSKKIYDTLLVGGVVLYLGAFFFAAKWSRPPQNLLDELSLDIRAYGGCAFLLLTLVLAIGPMARLDRRFLPLLYNRRHFGVVTCLVAGLHFKAVLDWYLSFSPLDPFVALLAMDASFGHLRGFPFIPFGLGAFVIMLLLAATSHDFWLSFLTPPVWKRLHMAIYAAYGGVVLHVAFGALQDAQNIGLPLLVVGGAALVCGLHLAAAWRERRIARDQSPDHAGGRPAPAEASLDDKAWHPDKVWHDAGPATGIAEGRARIIALPGGGRVALFRDKGRIFAISNICAHQNGPLGEGRIVDGKVVCPWHGYEYRLLDGCAPAPFTERVRTFRLRLANGHIQVDPEPLPLGAPSEPILLPETAP